MYSDTSESESGMSQAMRRANGYGQMYDPSKAADEDNIYMALEDTGVTLSQVGILWPKSSIITLID